MDGTGWTGWMDPWTNWQLEHRLGGANKFNSTLNCLFARCKCCGCKEFIRHKHCQRHNESWHQINIISFSIIEKLPRDLVARPNLSGLVTYMAKLMSLGIPGPIGVFQEILLASCLLYLEPIHGQWHRNPWGRAAALPQICTVLCISLPGLKFV